MYYLNSAQNNVMLIYGSIIRYTNAFYTYQTINHRWKICDYLIHDAHSHYYRRITTCAEAAYHHSLPGSVWIEVPRVPTCFRRWCATARQWRENQCASTIYSPQVIYLHFTFIMYDKRSLTWINATTHTWDYVQNTTTGVYFLNWISVYSDHKTTLKNQK